MDSPSTLIGPVKVTAEDVEFLRKGDPAEVAEKLNKLLVEVHFTAVSHALLGFPDTIRTLFKNTQALAELREKFFTQHPKLEKHKDKLVKAMARVEGNNPELKYEEIMEQAAALVYAELKVQAIPMKADPSSEDRDFVFEEARRHEGDG